MGVHRERLAASKAHSRFVQGARTALRRMGRKVPDGSEISPTIIGAQPLPSAVPPMIEEAFGYKGALRFVAFGYSPRGRSAESITPRELERFLTLKRAIVLQPR